MSNSVKGVRRHMRHLPLWRLEEATYFVTWRLHPAQSVLSADEREAVVASLRHFDGDRYDLPAFVVMNDHVHVVVRPASGFPLEKLVGAWKGFTSKQIIRTGGRRSPIWQEEYFDRILRSEWELIQKVAYVLHNPFKRWPDLTTYPWMSQ